MSQIVDNIRRLQAQMPQGVKILAVSKTKSVADIREAMIAGQLMFGENRALELRDKHQQIADAEWHFIGHLQTNKIKYIIPFVSLIHSADSPALLTEINRAAARVGRTVRCLLQIHIAREEQKTGFAADELLRYLDAASLDALPNIRVCGLMGVATNDLSAVRPEFHGLSQLFERIRSDYFLQSPDFCELSMGMSGDYPIAIDEGSTIIRVGSLIFGERNSST